MTAPEISASNAESFLEMDPSERELVGRHPRDVGREALRTLGHPESLRKAIRAKCLDCCCGQLSEVRRCTAVKCPLWPFRMNWNPFSNRTETFGKVVSGDEHPDTDA